MSTGLSRTDRITAIYNAVSLTHLLPVGGEDVYCYDGLLTLDRANGAETFDTISYGVAVTEHPSPGEVIWRDLSGVRQTPGCDTSWTNPRSGSGKLAKSVTPTTVSPPTGSGRVDLWFLRTCRHDSARVPTTLRSSSFSTAAVPGAGVNHSRR